MSGIEFRNISIQNLDEVIKLAVRPDQTNLVADNLYSIAQASLDPSSWCRGVYLNEKPVGFFFIKEHPDKAYICRFMIDQNHQRLGIGRKVMEKLLTLLFSSSSIDLVDLAVSKNEGGAEEFYKKCGFTSTNEPYKGGWRMVLSRENYRSLSVARSATAT